MLISSSGLWSAGTLPALTLPPFKMLPTTSALKKPLALHKNLTLFTNFNVYCYVFALKGRNFTYQPPPLCYTVCLCCCYGGGRRQQESLSCLGSIMVPSRWLCKCTCIECILLGDSGGQVRFGDPGSSSTGLTITLPFHTPSRRPLLLPPRLVSGLWFLQHLLGTSSPLLVLRSYIDHVNGV